MIPSLRISPGSALTRLKSCGQQSRSRSVFPSGDSDVEISLIFFFPSMIQSCEIFVTRSSYIYSPVCCFFEYLPIRNLPPQFLDGLPDSHPKNRFSNSQEIHPECFFSGTRRFRGAVARSRCKRGDFFARRRFSEDQT